MRFNGEGSVEPFCGQFEQVSSLFSKWNNCERTVVLCALLKRIPYSNLKFLQMLNEFSLTQALNTQSKLKILESNGNNITFLKELAYRYKNLSNNQIMIEENSLNFIELQEKKEEILSDILKYLPLLNPGNIDAKNVYMSLIPSIVDDTLKNIVSAELTQQIFSYMLIHPAVNSDDRRLISQWLRQLQNQMASIFAKPQIYPNKVYSSINSSTTSSLSPSSWQTITSPMENANWDIQHIKIKQDYCDEITKSLNNMNINSSGVIGSPTSRMCRAYDNSYNFSINTAELTDPKPAFLKNINPESTSGFLTVPGFEENAVKTRRSHSLTTSTPENRLASVENLGSALQKPRSFSLSMESPIMNMNPYGARLTDKAKPYVRFNTHNIGMSNIGHWLKSLRLHKYIWLFSDLTYEQMLEISEEYLENLGVTKGARNKLVLCIQKLKDRMQILLQMENELMKGTRQVHSVLDELTNIVLTPMKPIDMYSKDDVAGQLFKLVDNITSSITSHHSQIPEDAFNVALWILEKLIHNDAFLAQINQLKEHKYKLTKIRSQYMSDVNRSKKLVTKNGANKLRY